MVRPSLFGRRIHLAGSIAADPTLASADEVRRARAIVASLVKDLLRQGATFVIPVDAEKYRRGDDLPICFDWLIWRLSNNSRHSGPMARSIHWWSPLSIIRARSKLRSRKRRCGARFAIRIWCRLKARRTGT